MSKFNLLEDILEGMQESLSEGLEQMQIATSGIFHLSPFANSELTSIYNNMLFVTRTVGVTMMLLAFFLALLSLSVGLKKKMQQFLGDSLFVLSFSTVFIYGVGWFVNIVTYISLYVISLNGYSSVQDIIKTMFWDVDYAVPIIGQIFWIINFVYLIILYFNYMIVEYIIGLMTLALPILLIFYFFEWGKELFKKISKLFVLAFIIALFQSIVLVLPKIFGYADNMISKTAVLVIIASTLPRIIIKGIKSIFS